MSAIPAFPWAARSGPPLPAEQHRIAAALLQAYDNSYVPAALYIMLTAAISLVAVASIKDRNNQDLDTATVIPESTKTNDAL